MSHAIKEFKTNLEFLRLNFFYRIGSGVKWSLESCEDLFVQKECKTLGFQNGQMRLPTNELKC